MEYKYQVEKIKELDIQSGQSYRGDCIFCLHRNTLSVRNDNGKISWNCFHASCDAKGSTQSNFTTQDLQNFMDNKNYILQKTSYEIPKEFVTVYGNNRARDYISKFELEKTEARMMYDVKQNRLVFLVEDNGQVVGAIGRGLEDNVKPKWYKYNTPPVPFVVGTNKYIGFIVEDCISACKLALAGYTGIALMGTNLPDEFTKPIVDIIDNIFVCLDKDATNKSMVIRNKLAHHTPTYIEMLDKDLKWYSVEYLKKWGEELINGVL